MFVQSTLALLFTILGSVSIVAVIILLGWFLIWKAFLSKFRLVRELLGQADGQEDDPRRVIENEPNSNQYQPLLQGQIGTLREQKYKDR